MKRPLAGAGLLLLSAASLGRPQEPPPTPVFPARADLVLLDLVVRDKAGRLVEDLRTDEVQVLEDGKPCAVQSFRLVQAEGEKALRSPEPGAKPVPPPAVMTPEAAKPAVADDGLVGIVALVFDQLGPEGAKNARVAALQLAGRSFPKGSLFSVCKVGQNLEILQSFTEDRKSLPAAIEKATVGMDQARDPARNPRYDNATEEALSLARDAQAAAKRNELDARFMAMQAQMLLFTDSVMREGQGQASLQPLLAIARALSAVQGRKSLLYFSEGLAVPPPVEELFQTTVSTANRSNVSVYAFDARGLRVRSPSEETKLALDLARETAFSDQIGGAMPDEAVPTMGIDPLEMAQDVLRLNRQGVLRDLAESTGGFLVAETNDLRPGLERVMADLRAYYEVGYVPPNPKADGRWRAISVKVSRRGVVARTRRGYYAMPPGTPVVRADEVSPPGADAPGSSGEPAAGGITSDPLRAGHLEATPLLGRSFPEGTPAVSLLLSLYAGPAAGRPAVELEFRKDGQTVAHATPQLPAPDAGGRITYVGSFPTGNLGPGRYEVWARGRLGDVEASEGTAFTITPRAPLARPGLSGSADPQPGRRRQRRAHPWQVLGS